MTHVDRWTLPELLFAVAGGCLLLLAVGAHATGAAGGVPIADLVERIHVALQVARLEAVSGRTSSRVQVDPRAGRVEVWTGGDDATRHSEALVHGLALPRGTQLTWVGVDSPPRAGAPFEIVFDPSGLPQGGAGEIVVGSGDVLAGVEILADGDFRVTEPANGGNRAGF